MDIFTPKVKKEHIAIFLENMSFLIGCGYTAYDAAHWIIDPGGKKRDSESRAVRVVGSSIIDSLSEGFTLSTAMLRSPKYFGDYAKQIEAAEESGQVAEVLDQIVSSIRESAGLTQKLKSAMTYPIIVLSITFGVAWYLFSYVIPNILGMLTDVTGTESIPPTTQLVMNITDWMKQYGLALLFLIASIVVLTLFLANGPLKWAFHRMYTRMPLIGKISLASNVTSWMSSMKYMLQAGAPMASALSTAADSIKNVIRPVRHNRYGGGRCAFKMCFLYRDGARHNQYWYGVGRNRRGAEPFIAEAQGRGGKGDFRVHRRAKSYHYLHPRRYRRRYCYVGLWTAYQYHAKYQRISIAGGVSPPANINSAGGESYGEKKAERLYIAGSGYFLCMYRNHDGRRICRGQLCE